VQRRKPLVGSFTCEDQDIVQRLTRTMDVDAEMHEVYLATARI
jgi:hypothetical protein